MPVAELIRAALGDVIVLDTSALLALLDGDDPDHRPCVAALEGQGPPFLVPGAILGEVGYLIERKLGGELLSDFVEDLALGAFTLDCGDQDFKRIGELIRSYADLPLGPADAGVIACAERSQRRALTLDRSDFRVVAREGTIELALDQLQRGG